MSNKKSRLFLWMSLILFACSVIAVLVGLCVSYYQIQTEFSGDDTMAWIEWGTILGLVMVCVFPYLLVELSFIRSAYKILKYEPKGYVKICYTISAILAFVILAFPWLYFASIGLFHYDLFENDQNMMAEILLLTEWPVFIVSLVLGSIRKKQDDRCDTLPIEGTKK